MTRLKSSLSACLLLLAWHVAAIGAAASGAAAPVVLSPASSLVALEDHTQSWLDERGDLGIDAVEAAGDRLAWQPRHPGQHDRIDGQALWIRFDTTTTDTARWFLEVGSAGVDRVQLFHRDRAGAWVMQEAGDSIAVMRWPFPGRLPTFELATDSARPVRHWLRVEYARVDFGARLTALRNDTLLASREREQFLLGAYTGLAGLIALSALASGIFFRDRAFLAFALYIGLLGTGQLARLGIGAQHLWPDWQAWNEVSSMALPVLSSAGALWFVKIVTEPARFSRLLDLAAWAVLAAILASVAVDTVAGSRATFALALGCAVAGIFMLALLLAVAWRDGHDPGIRLLALGFVPLVLFGAFPIGRGLSLLPDGLLARYGILIGAVVHMPTLYAALRLRTQRRRESQLRAAALAHADALTGLSHRAGLVHRLETMLARARGQRHTCALLAVRIGNIEAIRDEYGREAAEKAIVVAASHLRRAMTDLDLAARVGDHEFAVLLDGPVGGEAAMSRAQQLVASGLRQSAALPQGLTLKFHVAVALLPHEEADAESSLAWTLEGLASMPLDSRKLIRALNF